MEAKNIEMHFKVLGVPRPKQSFRFTKSGKSFQSEQVTKEEVSFRTQIIPQLPKIFAPFDEAVEMHCLYVFPYPSSMKKKDIELAKGGKIYYKTTKPDITDNLNKGVADAMNGVVFIDDARICIFTAMKIFGDIPRVEIKINTLR